MKKIQTYITMKDVRSYYKKEKGRVAEVGGQWRGPNESFIALSDLLMERRKGEKRMKLLLLNQKIYTPIHKGSKYILAILNNSLAYFYQNLVSNTLLGQTTIAQKSIFTHLPIPKIPKSEQTLFVDLVDKILGITKEPDYPSTRDKQAKSKELERQIDRLVYKLYSLTDEEIRIVEWGK